MLSVYKDSVKIDDYTIEIFCGDSVPDSSVIWLHTFPGEAEEIWERLSGTSTLLAVTGNGWPFCSVRNVQHPGFQPHSLYVWFALV